MTGSIRHSYAPVGAAVSPCVAISDGLTLIRERVNAARRTRLAIAFSAVVLAAHLFLLVRGYSDPHKHFAFQPFNESDEWRAEVYRVDVDGAERPIDDGTWAYDWNELVGTPRLTNPWRLRHANSGAGSTIDFLDEALDWVIENTPGDPQTRSLRADVTWFEEGRGPFTAQLHSEERAS